MNADEHEPPMPPGLADEADTGLPLLRTWWQLYVFVVVVFCIWITGLVLLPVFFS